MQLKGMNGLARSTGGAVDRAREDFLAGAGLAGEEDRDVGGRDAPGNREQLGHLLGHPEAAVGLERVGGPQGGALLLLAAIAVERDGRLDQLADGDAGAAVGERGCSSATISHCLVAVGAAGDARRSPGLRRFDGLRVRPATVATARCCPRLARSAPAVTAPLAPGVRRPLVRVREDSLPAR